MKRIVVLLIVLILLIIPTFSHATGTNLVQNPGFEEGQGQDANYWLKNSWENKGVFSWDTEQKHSGQKSICIANNVATDSRYKQEIPVKENSYYKLSCWIKAEGVGEGGKGANLSIDGMLDTSKDFKGTTDGWKYVELYGKTGESQKSFVLTIGLGGYGDMNLNTGKAWFDDVSVEELEEAPDGANVVNLFSGNPETSDTNSSGKGGIWVFIVLVLTLFAVCFAFFIVKARKISGKDNAGGVSINPTIEAEGPTLFQISMRDIITMLSMTLIYAVIALVNLGSLNTPQTSWKPVKVGESIVVDLGKKADISRIYYYGGLGEGRYRVEYLDDTGKYVPLTSIEKKDIFTWKYVSTPNIITGRLKLIVDVPGATLNEVGIFENGSTAPLKGLRVEQDLTEPNGDSKVDNLFDEQDSIDYKHSYMSGMIFDEIYHARTAYEYLHSLEPFEWTHPPLGKVFISLGIMIFGMNPFGWRIVGTLFGILMVPVMYLFGKKLFGKSFYAFCTAFLMMFDFMHFSQTRIATIDVYGTFFVILMYYYMYDYFANKSYVLGFKNSLKPLALSGLFFGLGAASKWIGLYAGGGLALLFFMTKYQEYKDYLNLNKNKKAKKAPWLKDFFPLYINRTFLFCVLFFLLIPAIIYALSYIPYMMVPGPGHGFDLIFRNQANMLNYHSVGVLGNTHPFSSHWWEWPLIRRPLESYLGSDLPAGMSSSMTIMGNPAIWWVGIFAVVAAIIIALRKKDRKMTVIFVAMAFQYLPWVPIERLTFIYHFFSTVPFVIISIVYVIKYILEDYMSKKKDPIIRRTVKCGVYTYLAVVAILFFMFYPVLSGMEVPRAYVENFLLWFKGHWVF